MRTLTGWRPAAVRIVIELPKKKWPNQAFDEIAEARAFRPVQSVFTASTKTAMAVIRDYMPIELPWNFDWVAMQDWQFPRVVTWNF